MDKSKVLDLMLNWFMEHEEAYEDSLIYLAERGLERLSSKELLAELIDWFSDHDQARVDCIDYICRVGKADKEELYKLFG